MNISNTIASLRALRLGGMADALEQQQLGASWRDASFEDRLEHLLSQEILMRRTRKVERIRKAAKLRHNARPEAFDFRPSRGLEKPRITSLFRCDWIRDGRLNLLVTGLTGTGKTWAACAFGNAAAALELTVGYHRVGPLLEELELARHDGLRVKKLENLRRLDLLILDDLGLEELTQGARIDLLNLLEDRVGRRSTIVAAQMPVAKWHDYLGGDATADAIMDRLVHTSEQIELKGKSLRAGSLDKAEEPVAT
ncbi:IS21-like element helper ATPase IstB [Ruegeria sp. SCPT10]|uniref:IS21-like element helper ATPase IstB n=1 Tax=Ruegeria sp. SCP10 TaxID=3141377 RepID=UPI00333D698E